MKYNKVKVLSYAMMEIIEPMMNKLIQFVYDYFLVSLTIRPSNIGVLEL